MTTSVPKTALITGDAGFLGRHFRTELIARGYRVTGCDVINGPIFDCRTTFNDGILWPTGLGTEPRRPYDLTIHCAAIIGGRVRIDGNPVELAENIELDTLYARWLARVRPRHAIYLSSSAVYDVEDQLASGFDLDEDAQWVRKIGMPDQVYGWSKLTGELLMRHVIRAGVPVTVVRPFSGYGDDQSLDYPFPSFIKRASLRRDPFDIWGDGDQVRDFVHVDDVVNATLAWAEHDARVYAGGGLLRPVNICTGRPTSFTELAKLVCSTAGYDPAYRYVGDAPVGVTRRVCDPTLLRTVYKPTVSLEDGVRHALDRFTLSLNDL